MKLLKTLTINELAEKMRERGMSIGPEKLAAAIGQGLFKDFAHRVEGFNQNEYIIFEADFDRWAEAHSVEIHNADLVEFEKLKKKTL